MSKKIAKITRGFLNFIREYPKAAIIARILPLEFVIYKKKTNMRA